MSPPPPGPSSEGGLCPRCAHVQLVPGKNTTFLLCSRAKHDPRFPRYPPQPVATCPGFEPPSADGELGERRR